jgi:hypothetical protein
MPSAAAEVEHDFRFISDSVHAWKPGPMVRVNELLATGEPFAAPPSLLPLIRQSQVLAQQSDNLFNPAIGHLQRLWGFQTDGARMPAAAGCKGHRAAGQGRPQDGGSVSGRHHAAERQSGGESRLRRHRGRIRHGPGHRAICARAVSAAP